MAKLEMKTTDTQDTLVDSRSVPLSAPAHTLESGKVLLQLGSDAQRGLSEEQVLAQQKHYGPNRLEPPARPSLLRICGRQIINAMSLVLIAATAVSFGTRDWISGAVILVLVLLNISVGTYTEWQAEKTVASLEAVGSPTANVIRHAASEEKPEGRGQCLAIEEVVPGDIITLINGDIVPADARILDGYLAALESDEALLTGESLPVAKKSEPLEEASCPVGDRKNMVFAGSQITKGRARAVVTAIGMSTELGAIAVALKRKQSSSSTGWKYRKHRIKAALGLAETTSLQIKLNWLAYILLAAACLIAFIVVASTAFTDVPLSVATYAVAAAVSLLPASLVAVVSLTLATASNELAKRKALVRRMDAIEALAQVTDVCSDKTGTLTVGKMVAKKIWIPSCDDDAAEKSGQIYAVESGSDPFYPRGAVSLSEEDDDDRNEDDGETIDIRELDPALRDLGLCASLANMASISRAAGEESWSASGDATEIALQVMAHKLGLSKTQLTRPAGHVKSQSSRQSARFDAATSGHYELLVDYSFDSTVKRMSAVYRFCDEAEKSSEHVLVLMKGAVERTLERCVRMGLQKDGPTMDETRRSTIAQKVEDFAAKGLRVLALCGRMESSDTRTEHRDRNEVEKNLGFLGLVGIYDPPRPESAGAVGECKLAGITPRMLTGDHPATAVAIARQIGILDANTGKSAVMTGQEFDAMSEQDIDSLSELPVVIARCAPETKVRMIEALHRRKRMTVMTGDGVNDSPALKRADVGVAMGLNGSDVAKQSADIVLADDNFETIIRAIRKGRSVYSNLSKFLLFLLSSNVAEVVVLLIGLAFRDENGISVFPLSPVAALFINTLSAGPPAFGLGLEPTAKDAMFKTPQDYQTIFTFQWICDLFFYGLLMASLTLVNFVIVAWGRYDGYMGVDCNEGFNASCEIVFEARATAFASLMFMLMLHALVCKHPAKSLFSVDLLDNKFLLWVVILLSLATFPPIYIPTIDEDVFFFRGLSWEWGIVFGMLVLYLMCCELWKLCRRTRQIGRAVEPVDKSLRLADTVQA